MRRTLVALFAAALALPALVRAQDGPGEPPPTPTTPLPKFDNPLFDAEVGETCLYKVREPGTDDGWVLWFEERVLARTAKRVLVETVKTDKTGTKDFGVDNTATRWWDVQEGLTIPPGWTHEKSKDKDELLYLGGPPPTHAVRTTKRHIEGPTDPSKPDGLKTRIQTWFSHDVAVRGIAKRFPAQRDGERVAVAWSKRLPAEECARRAERYPDLEAKAGSSSPTAPSAPSEPGMDEPGMAEPGMDEPGMAEPAMEGGDAPAPGMGG